MRSSDAAALEAVHEKFKKAAEQALHDEKERWKNNGALAVKTDLVGYRPAGRTAESAPITQAVVAVTRAIDSSAGVLREGSTDANVGMNRRVPALTIGGGGRATGGHSPGETYDPTDSWKGTQRVLLVALALTQP
jgi:tripeptide aminopeptidase